jgi:hypothetical protein
MQVISVPADHVVLDQAPASERTFDLAFCTNGLAMSIRAQGLLYEPIVQPVAGRPGHYAVRAGRHRAYTCLNVLKWAELPCKVAPEDWDEDMVRMAEIGDNLFRTNLEPERLRLHVIAWRQLHEKKRDALGKAQPDAPQGQNISVRQRARAEAAAGVERVATGLIEAARAAGEEVDEEREAELRGQAEARRPGLEAEARGRLDEASRSFSAVLSQSLGISIRAARRLARQARVFDPDTIKVLGPLKLGTKVYDKLAALEDREAIEAAVKLICSGSDPAQAIRVASRPKREREAAAARAAGATVEVVEADLTDEEWLEQNCGTILRILRQKTKRLAPFRRDALLYRRVCEPLAKFRGAVKKGLHEARDPTGQNGLFYMRIASISHLSHPSHWQICGMCDGSGVARDRPGECCSKCVGGGYTVPNE